MKLKDLKINPDNPFPFDSKRDWDKLKESLRDNLDALKSNSITYDSLKGNLVISGNKRTQALLELGHNELPDEYFVDCKDWTDKQIQDWIFQSNVQYGFYDINMITEEQAEEYGIEFEEVVELDDIESSDTFELPSGDREPFQEMTFTFADEQSIFIKNAISEIRKTEEFKYMETMGNENGNGNAMYLLVTNAIERK